MLDEILIPGIDESVVEIQPEDLELDLEDSEDVLVGAGSEA